MKKLNHLFIIPDANRRHARRQYLTDLFKKSEEEFKEVLIGFPNENRFSEEEFSKLEGRINLYSQTGLDPFYEYDLDTDLLDSNKIPLPQNYLLNSYRKGGEVLTSLIKYILDNKIVNILSIYGSQKNNFGRTKDQVDSMLVSELEVFNYWKKDNQIVSQCDFKFVGDKTIFDLYKTRVLLKNTIDEYVDSIEQLEKKACGNKLKVYVLTPYDAEWEINQAIIDGKFSPNNLVVKEKVDLIIRTGNVKSRVSGGIPYQTQSSQFSSVKQYFPDFTTDIFQSVLDKYRSKERESGL